MEFGIPPRNEEVSAFPLNMPPKLRADGNLTYPQFIDLVKTLWSESHPDIPIRPSQSKKYSQYPVIVYSLEMRKTHATEPKKRFREMEYRKDENTHLRIAAQRFDNVITFTAMTEANPELCEMLIEAFEDFMMEYTPIFKQFGVSDFHYTRRLPDRDVTRPDEDIEERAVSYLVVLEKVIVTEVDKIKNIIAKVRVSLGNQWAGSEFWGVNPDDENGAITYLTCPNNPFEVGDLVSLILPHHTQDDAMYGELTFTVPRDLPGGLHNVAIYQISSIDVDKIYLKTLSGVSVSITSAGMGRIVGAPGYVSSTMPAEIIDDLQSTPSY